MYKGSVWRFDVGRWKKVSQNFRVVKEVLIYASVLLWLVEFLNAEMMACCQHDV